MRKVVVYGSMLVAVVALLPQLKAVTWTIEPVTSSPVNEEYPFLAIDGQNFLHIAYSYYEPSDEEIFYATNSSGSWQTSRVTDNSTDDQSSDILVTPTGTVHIAIAGNDGTDGEIYHASGTPGSWSIERVTDDSKNDFFPSIAIDAQGYLHMAYHKVDPSGTDFEIFYANNKPGHWVEEQVTFNTVDDVGASLALDKAGNPHIAFWRGAFPNMSVYYVQKIAGVWDEKQVAPPPTRFPAMVLDKNDFAHIAYSRYDGADYEIYYANNVSGVWQQSQVTSNSTDDRYNSIRLDSKGFVHIVYLGNDGDDEVYYADNVAGVWQIGRVTDNTVNDQFFGFHEFAIDGLGFGHIVFWNNLNGNYDIYHARSTTPIAEGVDERPTAPVTNGLVLRPNSPDPFVGSTFIGYELPAPGLVSITIYDAAGTLVRSLVNEQKPAGSFRTAWDGKSTQGKPVTAGVYFCKLTCRGRSLTEKLLVVR